ncbi:uncharacterized protein LOC133888074 isoform X2 [Phragmites australis]|uniref:uncharacterized protein LOC133888074 isoform X2 n=1 Tax=Phragmites australis TaxID=29695 RepID=UPI002D79E7A8|nr:uncharacterized protein LOC133888074 isoform X2 [Phragmites australis]
MSSASYSEVMLFVMELKDEADVLCKIFQKSDVHDVNCVRPDRTSSPDIPFDSIQIQQLLAEIVSFSSMNILCTAVSMQPYSTSNYVNDNEVLLDDSETIFCELDVTSSQSVESNSNHCNSCGEHFIHPMLEALGTEQYLELNDLSFLLLMILIHVTCGCPMCSTHWILSPGLSMTLRTLPHRQRQCLQLMIMEPDSEYIHDLWLTF